MTGSSGQWSVVSGQCASGSAAPTARNVLTRSTSEGAVAEDRRSSYELADGSRASRSSLTTSHQPPATTRRGFTLVELLITVSVIAIMATMVLFALFAAQETAKAQKTKSLIAKLDSIIKAKYETYKTRRVNITLPKPPPVTDTTNYPLYVARVARARLDCLHDLMRMEIPERWTDVEDNPRTFTYAGFGSAGVRRPSVSMAFFRRWNVPSKPTDEFQGAECLYMIIMAAQGEEADDKSAIKQDQIGDVDNDGFPEIIDAWGQPIKFLRWAPGFVSDLQIAATLTSTNAGGSSVESQSNQLSSTPGSYVGGALIAEDPLPANAGRFLATDMAKITGYNFTAGTGRFDFTGGPFSVTPPQRFYVMSPDPFDPRGVQSLSFAIYPLIYSSGPDKCYGILSEFNDALKIHWGQSPFNDNPFYVGLDAAPPSQQRMIGAQRDEPGEKNFVTRAWVDNIHNHMITAR